MFYGNEYLPDDIFTDDYTKATTLQQLKSMIERVSQTIEFFHKFNAPVELKDALNDRLIKMVTYYNTMGGNAGDEPSTYSVKKKLRPPVNGKYDGYR